MNGAVEKKEIKHRQFLFGGFIIIAFLVLMVRLFYLQILQNEKYLRASEGNRIRREIIRPMRGLILDRNGKILVDNHPAYDVFVIPFEIEKNDTAMTLLADIFEISADSLRKMINSKKTGKFTPVRVKSFIDFPTLSKIEENKIDLPGVIIRTEPRRLYPDTIHYASHVLGYVGEVTKEELAKTIYDDVFPGDFVGKRGIEKYYDALLRGKSGERFYEVDALGREIRNLNSHYVEPEPGKNLYLTIDSELQKFISKKLGKNKGAVIVASCETGEILAMVSKPEYPLEIFSKPLSSSVWSNIVNDPNKPLFDRSIQSLYPPGSTYKLVLATAALEKGINPFSKKFICKGVYFLGNTPFRCWKASGHGELNLLEAIEHSCNVYFYQLGLEVGLEQWSNTARKLMLNQPTNIDLPDESSAPVPDENFLNEKYGEGRWQKGIILNEVIGQGDVLATPIQMLRLALIFANNGSYYRPHLLRFYEDKISGKREWTPVQKVEIKNITKDTFEIINQAMWRVVNGANGTARLAIVPGIEIAGKTGTAENPHGNPHAWFIGFAPYTNPKIAFTIIIENGGSGGAASALLAREMIKYIFKGNFSL